MFNINWDILPKNVIYNISYIIFYSAISYIMLIFIFLLFITYWKLEITDYQLLVWTAFLAIPLWLLLNFIITPLEKIKVKRNIFISWIITILKENKVISFDEILRKYSFMLFQSEKVISSDNDWTCYIEALVVLWVIKVVNLDKLLEKDKDFDYNSFGNKLFDAELSLKDKNVSIDELIAKVDNYIL